MSLPAPKAPPAASPTAWGWVPRGVPLDEAGFLARHRTLSVVLLVHVPALAALAVGLGRTSTMLWALLATMLLAAAGGQLLTGQASRASCVSLGLVLGSDALVHVGGGQTDLHIHFYVMLALVALYQSWAPFLVAIGFVAVHHVGLSLVDPTAVFSDPQAQARPVLFALLHAGFLLAMATGLAAGWRFSERAEAERLAQLQRAEEQTLAQLRAQEELAQERAASAAETEARLRAQDQRAAELDEHLARLDSAGSRLTQDVTTVSSVMRDVVLATADISAAADEATGTAQEADDRARSSAACMAQLSATIHEVADIASSISSIAQQTNLLALNATIEAARAGTYGKGFAVVAGEVKELARETALATEHIRTVVESVQSETARAGEEIDGIQTVIDRVVRAQATIVAAVEEQRLAGGQAQQAVDGAALEVEQIARDLQAVTALR